MKKIVIVSMMAVSMILFIKPLNAQTQRMTLDEQFTNAS